MMSSNGAGKMLVVVRFRLPYYTQWGQSLLICGAHPAFGSWNVKQGLSLVPYHEGDELVWSGQVTVQEPFELRYYYCVVDEKRNVLRREAGIIRELVVPSGLANASTIDVHDFWQECVPESLLERSAFKDAIFRTPKVNNGFSNDGRCDRVIGETKADRIVVGFKVRCPSARNEESVFVTGNCIELGRWDCESALKLSRIGESTWQGYCNIDRKDFPIKYSYVLQDIQGKITSELGGGRRLNFDAFQRKPSSLLLVSDGYFKAVPWRGAGLAIPVFSIRSGKDVGAGEFLDIKLLVDFAVKCGLRLLQLLPVNDTSVNGMWWDSYPYSSLSVFALHPLYLRLEALARSVPENIKEEIAQAREALDLKDVDYEATMRIKLSVAKKLFHLNKDEVFQTSKFKCYFEENKHWLKPFAAFCYLRDFFGTSDHSQWGLFSSHSEAKMEKIVSPQSEHYNAVCFTYYLQFHLHSQLSEASEYARENGIVLKGDLPIGVDRNSVDTWVFPTLFRMNTSTGAPPDYFDKNGQNWGFPTYNWEEMSKDNYAWWRARLTQMSKYFSAYRIDHILGFFRIWELPAHAVTGLMGTFRPSIPLSQEELERRGIWDFDRLSEPYILSHTLKEKFGSAWTDIANKYMIESEHLRYKFKPEFSTEKKILSGFEESEEIKNSLFDLLHDVVLIRDTEDSTKFYPMFGMEDTYNFKELDDSSKDILRSFYYDYFYHRQEALWQQNALKTLPVLMSSSDMLTCGEDLGMIPACVPPVLKELGLLGLRIQRMPCKAGEEFANPAEYDYMTVCAPSCHDCSPLRAWWEEDESRRLRFYKNFLQVDQAPPAKCTPEVAGLIIKQHMESPSMWAIFPLQDLLALREEYSQRPAAEETINDPTNPKHYWRYRSHVSVETLLSDQELTSLIKEMLCSGGRECKQDGFPKLEL